MSDGSRPATHEGAVLRLSGVSKQFITAHGASTQALHPIDLSVPAGQFVAVIGPSGCGKSTLLRVIDGLLPPDQGEILVNGESPRPGEGIGLVFQNFRLIPWRRVVDNVSFALEAAGVPKAERRDEALAFLHRVGLQAWAQHYPAQLSGGMRQRVALARVLITRPRLLLLDEPFASLDAQTRELMQDYLLSLIGTERPTVLLVTHSVDEALLADRILVMGQGKVLDDIEVGLPRPRSMEAMQGTAAHAALRRRLWGRIRELVLADPASPFFQSK